jgi:hypothetical protein
MSNVALMVAVEPPRRNFVEIAYTYRFDAVRAFCRVSRSIVHNEEFHEDSPNVKVSTFCEHAIAYSNDTLYKIELSARQVLQGIEECRFRVGMKVNPINQ